MGFPTVRSGELFGSCGPADRNMYFDALAAADVTEVEPAAYFGHNGWMRMTEGMKPEDAVEGYYSQVAPMSFQERRDFAYGNALGRYLDNAFEGRFEEASMRGTRVGAEALCGNRSDLFGQAVSGQFDPDAATAVLMKSTLGGD